AASSHTKNFLGTTVSFGAAAGPPHVMLVLRRKGLLRPVNGPIAFSVFSVPLCPLKKQNRQVIDLPVTKRVSCGTPGAWQGGLNALCSKRIWRALAAWHRRVLLGGCF